MPFSRHTILELSMTLVCLSGAKSLRDPLVSQLLGEWVASSPLDGERSVGLGGGVHRRHSACLRLTPTKCPCIWFCARLTAFTAAVVPFVGNARLVAEVYRRKLLPSLIIEEVLRFLVKDDHPQLQIPLPDRMEVLH